MIRATAILILGVLIGMAVARGNEEGTNPLQVDALRLVLDKRAAEMRGADDPKTWNHDTKRRTWTVRRPFEPGLIDSTHFFSVTYEIDGKPAGSWSVNTRTGAVAGPGESISME